MKSMWDDVYGEDGAVSRAFRRLKTALLALEPSAQRDAAYDASSRLESSDGYNETEPGAAVRCLFECIAGLPCSEQERRNIKLLAGAAATVLAQRLERRRSIWIRRLQ